VISSPESPGKAEKRQLWKNVDKIDLDDIDDGDELGYVTKIGNIGDYPLLELYW
jgi:hypothetical protein